MPFELNVTELTQTPPRQNWVPLHTCPQVPQFALSARMLSSQPFDATPSQFPNPAAQDATPQVPPRQYGVALGSAHETPQPPQ
jgi:hypothetical protein